MIPPFLEIKKSNNGKGLFSKQLIKKDSIIFHFEGKLGTDAETNDESLQIDEDLFLESTTNCDDFLNHSCDPNCYIDFNTLNLVALKEIRPGEELCFDYNTTEYDLVNLIRPCPFKCGCGSNHCLGEIKGSCYLSIEQKKKIKKYLAPYLKKKLEQELKSLN